MRALRSPEGLSPRGSRRPRDDPGRNTGNSGMPISGISIHFMDMACGWRRKRSRRADFWDWPDFQTQRSCPTGSCRKSGAGDTREKSVLFCWNMRGRTWAGKGSARGYGKIISPLWIWRRAWGFAESGDIRIKESGFLSGRQSYRKNSDGEHGRNKIPVPGCGGSRTPGSLKTVQKSAFIAAADLER